jgi:cAMP-dependent protein kinase regulator
MCVWLQLGNSFLFEGLDAGDVDIVVDAMRPLTCAAGTVVIRQGDEGTEFYVVASGSLVVVVNGKQTSTLDAGSHFGELALMFNTPRYGGDRPSMSLLSSAQPLLLPSCNHCPLE